MPETIDILAWAGGGVVVVGGIAGFSYWLFKLFSEKWLTAKFNERLEDYKHKQQRELEELKFKINALMDRTTKLHQREFDVLPEAWGRLIDAHGHALSVTSPVQQFANLDIMTQQQLSEFLENSPLANWQKEEVKGATKKAEHYRKAYDWHRYVEATNTNRDFYGYLRKSGIFIREEIKVDFDAIADLIYDALAEQEFHLEHAIYGPDSRKARTKFISESNGMLKELEKKVQARLWDSQTEGSIAT